MPEFDSEERLVDELLLNHVLDGSLDRRGCNSVDGGPGETQQTVVAAIGEEAAAQLLRALDCLVRDGNPSNGHDVRIHVARRRGAVAVGDVPRARGVLCGARLARVVDRVRLGVL